MPSEQPFKDEYEAVIKNSWEFTYHFREAKITEIRNGEVTVYYYTPSNFILSEN